MELWAKKRSCTSVKSSLHRWCSAEPTRRPAGRVLVSWSRPPNSALRGRRCFIVAQFYYLLSELFGYYLRHYISTLFDTSSPLSRHLGIGKAADFSHTFALASSPTFPCSQHRRIPIDWGQEGRSALVLELDCHLALYILVGETKVDARGVDVPMAQLFLKCVQATAAVQEVDGITVAE